MPRASYLKTYKTGVLQERIELALEALSCCTLCPRRCGVDRLHGEEGFCRTGRRVRVASCGPHFGEERPLVGRGGSGTIFISSCNLRCSFCQNYEISHYNQGALAGREEFADMMLSLQAQGCHNINFVTPSHVIPQILEALPMAIEGGLCLPLVYNTGGYDRVESLELLRDIIDIYMPDFKFWDNTWSIRYCQAPDYREMACQAIAAMHAQVGDLALDAHGVAYRGLLVRHLVLPGGVAGSGEVMRFIARHISQGTYVNVMDQYRPCYLASGDETLGRRTRPQEYGEALRAALDAGLTRLDPVLPIV